MPGKDRGINVVIAAKDAASAILGKVGLSIAGLAAAAFAAKQVFDVLAGALSAAVTAASKQEDADVKLAAALRTVGQNTAAVRQDLDNFASGLQDLTTIDDQVIQGMAGILASLGRLTGEGLKRATLAALDFAAATGQDGVAAATLVAKAADGSTAALSRYGIRVEEGLSKSEAFSRALEIMERKFGGLAAASGQTFSAALRRIDNDFTDLQEQIGAAIVKSDGFRVVTAATSTALKDLQRLLRENPQLLEDLERGLLTVTIAAARTALAVGEAGVVLVQNTAHLREALSVLAAIASGQSARAIAEIGIALATATSATKEASPALDALRVIIHQAEESLKGLQNELASTARLEKIAGEQGFETAEGLAAIRELIRGRGAGKVDVPELLGPGEPGKTTGDVKVIEDAFKSLGTSGIAEAEKAAAALRLKMGELFEQELAGALEPGQFDRVSEGILIAAESLREFGVVVFEELEAGEGRPFDLWREDVEAFNKALKDSKTPLEELGFNIEELAVTIQRELVGAALDFGDALVDAAFSAGRSWDAFFKALFAAIAKALVRLLVLKLIALAFDIGTSGVGGEAVEAGTGGGTGGGGFVTAQRGGRVSGGTPGVDSVLTALTPGEIVLPTRLSGAFEAVADLARQLTGRGGGARALPEPGMQVFNRIEPRRDRLQDAIQMVEDINDLAERRGFRVVATEVVG